jgi:hypothetical protein
MTLLAPTLVCLVAQAVAAKLVCEREQEAFGVIGGRTVDTGGPISPRVSWTSP